jgi:hypothetical protein
VFIPALKADMYLLWPWELIKGTSAKEAPERRNKKTEQFSFFGGVSTPFFTSLNFISRVTSIFLILF